MIYYFDIISIEIYFKFYLAIITCSNDISILIIAKISITNLNYKISFNISRFTLNILEIPKSSHYSFATYSRNKTIDIFYTNTLFSKFKNFINKNYKKYSSYNLALSSTVRRTEN